MSIQCRTTRETSKKVRWDAYLHVPDPDALEAEFASRSVEFSEPLKDTDDGLRGFELKDADWLRLVFRSSSILRLASSAVASSGWSRPITRFSRRANTHARAQKSRSSGAVLEIQRIDTVRMTGLAPV